MSTTKLWEWVLAPGRINPRKNKKVLTKKKWVDSALDSKAHGLLSKKINK